MKMPLQNKCWYKDCDSEIKKDPKLLFYKFPRDVQRCEKWIANCANPILTEIYIETPERITTFRVCQKHFLKEFLGTSSRLVGHAVPSPYGLPLQGADVERFMVDCANLRCTSSLDKRNVEANSNSTTLPPQPASQVQVQTTNNNDPIVIDLDYHQQHQQPFHVRNFNCLDLPFDHNSEINLEQQDQHFQDLIEITQSDSSLVYNSIQSYLETQDEQPSHKISENFYSHQLNSTSNLKISTIQPPDKSTVTRQKQWSNSNKEGNVTTIHFPKETPCGTSSSKDEQIAILKRKLNREQRRVAALRYRYKKLKSQNKVCSNMKKLLNVLEFNKDSFDPCTLELFKAQIKSSSTRQGNRWSDTVKNYAASIYVESKSAYRIVRKKINLPSEPIVQRQIEAGKLVREPRRAENDEDKIEEEEGETDEYEQEEEEGERESVNDGTDILQQIINESCNNLT